MVGRKTNAGNRTRTRVFVKRDQSGNEDVQKKRDASPRMKEKGDSMALDPETGSIVDDVDGTKATSTSAERIVSGIEAVFRPIAKELIKGGIVVVDAVSEMAAETGDQFKDLLAEAKSELERSQSHAQVMNRTEGTGSH